MNSNAMEPTLKSRQDFHNHKVRTVRHQYDNFPGNIQPDLESIKEVIRDKYNSVVNDEEHEIDKETWDEFVQLSIINAGYRNGKKKNTLSLQIPPALTTMCLSTTMKPKMVNKIPS